MKMQKGIGLTLLILLIAMLSVPTALMQDDTSFTIGVVHNNADHPSITAIVRGMEDEAAIYGAQLVFLDPAFDPQRQASMIEDLIAQQVDVIVVNAVDPAAVVPSLRLAAEAGIPVITQNADTNEDGRQYVETFVGSDSVIQGIAVGQMIREALGGEGNLVILSGNPGQTDVVNRISGMEQSLAGSNITVLDTQPAGWSKDRALTIMQDLLTRYPDIDAVFALDDPMALGALEAIKAEDRLDDIKVFGVNGNLEACQAIEAGEMAGTALQLSYLVGVYTVRAAYDAHVGRILPSDIKAPTAGITADNVAQWIGECW